MRRALAIGLVSLAACQDRSEVDPTAPASPAGASAVDPMHVVSALEAGVSPDALERLRDLVAGLVRDGETAGIELLVVQSDRTVLHEAFGDVERNVERCARSLARPLLGTAALMLVDDGALELDARVADHVPQLDAEDQRATTIEELLGRPGDAGAVAALVGAASGAPAQGFVRARVLEPLGMDASALVPGEGLCTTAVDFAKLLRFWLDKGRAGRERLLSMRCSRAALRAGPHSAGEPTGFEHVRSAYGLGLQLRLRGDELFAYGCSGPDGAHAWAFPRRNALAIYFTSSGGDAIAPRVEAALGELFFGPPFDPNSLAPPLDEYLGLYSAGPDSLYTAIVPAGTGLGLELVGSSIMPLTYAGSDRWRMVLPSEIVTFDRAADGRVVGYRASARSGRRLEPDPSLPSAEDVVARVVAAHGLDQLDETALRIHARTSNDANGIAGSMRILLASGGRFRVDFDGGSVFERTSFDGDFVRYASSMEAGGVLDETSGTLTRIDSLAGALGDWRWLFDEIEVVQRSVLGEPVLVVRVTGAGRASTRYVSEATGRVLGDDCVLAVPFVAVPLGQRARYSDYREAGPTTLPHWITIECEHPLIGTTFIEVEWVELDVELSDDTFELVD